MVRLVFRPYTQIRRSICTSEPLRASTRVSSGFALFRHSSPSFGSQQLCSYSNPSKKSRSVDGAPCGSHLHSLSLRARVFHPNTRTDVRLLGPCFKTGRLRPLRQHPRQSRGPQSQLAVLHPGFNTASSYIPRAFIRPSKLMLASKPELRPPQVTTAQAGSLISSASLSTISRTV